MPTVTDVGLNITDVGLNITDVGLNITDVGSINMKDHEEA